MGTWTANRAPRLRLNVAVGLTRTEGFVRDLLASNPCIYRSFLHVIICFFLDELCVRILSESKTSYEMNVSLDTKLKYGRLCHSCIDRDWEN